MANVSVEDDEPDYMSDDFLAKCIPEDVRPGLKRVNIISVQNIIFSIDGLTEVIKLKTQNTCILGFTLALPLVLVTQKST